MMHITGNVILSNVRTRDLGFQIESKWMNGAVHLTNIDNYTYFDENNAPQQFEENVTYLKAKVSKEFTYRKFALNNTLMYPKSKYRKFGL